MITCKLALHKIRGTSMKHMLYLLLFISTACYSSENQSYIKGKLPFIPVCIHNNSPFCIRAYIRGSIQDSGTHYRDILSSTEMIPAKSYRTIQIKNDSKSPLCTAVVVVYMHDKVTDMGCISGIEKMMHADINVECGNPFHLSVLQ